MNFGFIDLQVNGFGGVSFSDERLTDAGVQSVCSALAERGTEAFCPTVVTTSPAAYRRVLPLLARAVTKTKPPVSGTQAVISGIHLEGPFISPEDGAVGVHPRQYTRIPSLEDFDELYHLAEGKILLMTLAPELPGALDLIRHAVALGVIVSLGHTLADSATISAAFDAGARLSTHLGNGLPNIIHRHANPLWPQIAHPELTAMLITDGHHLPADLIATVVAAKGPGRVIVTSDAAPAAGLPPGDYAFFGSRVRLEPLQPGAACSRLRNLDADTLAGSAATMHECMAYLSGLNLLGEKDLQKVGRENALKVVSGRWPVTGEER